MTDDTAAPSPALAALLASSSSSSAPLDPARRKQPSSSSSSGAATPTRTRTGGGPIPMSMPAILIGPKNKHLLGALGGGGKRASSSRKGGGDHESGGGAAPGGGKRRRRRWENNQLAGNPHVSRPTRADFHPPTSTSKRTTTTFAPPPADFPRSTYLTPAQGLDEDDDDARGQGQFHMSLRGLRRTVRNTVVGPRVRRGDGGRTEEVLDIMERELRQWLLFQGRVEPGFYHDVATSPAKTLDPTPLEDYPTATVVVGLPDEPVRTTTTPRDASGPPATLVELTRLPHQLVWLAPHPQHRFLIHALARYYRLQSFSRPLDRDTRVTTILRPQLSRRATARVPLASGFDTPSATDVGTTDATVSASEIETESSEAEFTDGDGGSTDFASTDDEDEAAYVGRTLDELSSSGGDESEYGADRELGLSDAYYTEDDDDDDDSHSLASSFADLSTAAGTTAIGSAVPAHPTSIAAAAPAPPFVPYTPGTGPATLTMTTRARGRRTSAGLPLGRAGSSAESSPSRSPTRSSSFVAVPPPGEWAPPERSFVDWVFE
ncbi:hypothetical protein JCM11491_000051 [Sporobolomyces phaffii]